MGCWVQGRELNGVAAEELYIKQGLCEEVMAGGRSTCSPSPWWEWMLRADRIN